MREIKFRVWDGRKNEWGTIYWGEMGDWLQDPECCVEQYTGLRDKKRTKEYPEGQEIYEGDIVRLQTHKAYLSDDKDKYRQEIVTNGCRCGLNTNGLLSIKKEGQEEYEPQLVVIGNIHENKELIEAGKESE